MKRDSLLYDVVVIGGGTAGSNAARSALAAGAKRVLLIHTDSLLNTCIEEGCMPSKSMLGSGHQGMPFAQATERMEGHIDRLLDGLKDVLSNEKFEMEEGTARFLPHEEGLEVTSARGTRVVSGRKYVIATGSTSFIPPLQGLESISKHRVLTSRDVVSKHHVSSLPASVFILGGGPIGLEMTTAFLSFGASVVLADKGHLLSRLDHEFGELMERALSARERLTLLTDAEIKSVTEKGEGIIISVEQNGEVKEYESEALFFATGRKPRLEELELSNVGLELERGRLSFDERTLQTKHDAIYVAGDVVGSHQILHYASAMGKIAGHNAAGKREELHYENLNMGVIFADPQVAHIGLTETEAKEKSIATVSASVDLSTLGRGLLENESFGLWKIVAEEESGRILGAQAVGPAPHSEWLVDLVAWIMHFKGTAVDIKKKEPYYHPTYPELLQTLGRELCEKLGEVADRTICPN